MVKEKLVLRTLNDFNVECENQVAQSVLVERHYDLKQEGIKWTKEFKKRGQPKIKGDRTTGEVGNFYKIEAFKEFFNITEEDLI